MWHQVKSSEAKQNQASPTPPRSSYPIIVGHCDTFQNHCSIYVSHNVHHSQKIPPNKKSPSLFFRATTFLRLAYFMIHRASDSSSIWTYPVRCEIEESNPLGLRQIQNKFMLVIRNTSKRFSRTTIGKFIFAVNKWLHFLNIEYMKLTYSWQFNSTFEWGAF